MKRGTPVYCSVPSCGSIVFAVTGDSLVISARHHGERHVSVFPFDDLPGQLVLPDGRTIQLRELPFARSEPLTATEG